MLTSLTLSKKIGKQAQTQPTLTDILKMLKAQGLNWERTELAFQADGARTNAVKSLKAIAKQNAFLQPHFCQKMLDSDASRATGGWQIIWKTQNFAEAIAEKNKKIATRQSIAWTLPGDAADCEETLRAIDTILADYPQKNYQYIFQADFVGLRFGDDTLVDLPEQYAKGRGPAIKDGMNDALRGIKWAHSHARFGRDKFGCSLLTHCLLDESYNAPEKASALPDRFVSLAKALCAFKAKDVIRRPILSVQESDDHYAKLTPEQRTKLDREILIYTIGRERALYREGAGQDFAESMPVTEDAKELHGYLMKISQAINQTNKQAVRVYNIAKLRQAAAKAILEDNFTSLEALELNAPENEEVVAARQRREKLVSDALQKAGQHLQALLSEGKLPHRLESYYFAEGILRQIGQTEDGKVIVESVPNPNPKQTSYAPYHHLWVPEDQPVPASLQAVGYRRDSVRPYFEQMKQLYMGIYQNLTYAMGYFKKAWIDGIECYVVATDREKINRRKILGAAFKPLGYEFVKQPQGSVGSYELKKPLSETESLICDFDFGTWRQTIDCTLAYRDGTASAPKQKRFRMVLTGWSYPGTIAISSEELFTKAIENIGAMAAILERDHIGGLRESIKSQ